MKITTPEEFRARPDPNAPRVHVVDELCERIERELEAGRLSIPAGVFGDGVRSSEFEAAAERYRAVGWTVYAYGYANDLVLRLDYSLPRHTVPGTTLSARIGSVDSPVPYLGRGGCRRGNDG